MNISELLNKKTELRNFYKDHYGLLKRPKTLIAISCENKKMQKKITKGLSILPANFIILGEVDEKIEAKNIAYEVNQSTFDMIWIDAVIHDGQHMKLEKVMEVGVVPIVSNNNYLGKILTEFHPGRAEGNSYLFEDESPWSAYYAVIRYLENHKFPYDNRNLIKNITWM